MTKLAVSMSSNLMSNGFINSVYEESPYGIIVFNKALEVLDWNPAVEKLIGLTREACMGQKLFDVFPALETLQNRQTDIHNIKGTMVVAEAISGYFMTGMLNGMKVSIIVDKSGAVEGGTLILTTNVAAN